MNYITVRTVLGVISADDRVKKIISLFLSSNFQDVGSCQDSNIARIYFTAAVSNKLTEIEYQDLFILMNSYFNKFVTKLTRTMHTLLTLISIYHLLQSFVGINDTQNSSNNCIIHGYESLFLGVNVKYTGSARI